MGVSELDPYGAHMMSKLVLSGGIDPSYPKITSYIEMSDFSIVSDAEM